MAPSSYSLSRSSRSTQLDLDPPNFHKLDAVSIRLIRKHQREKDRILRLVLGIIQQT